MDKESQEKQCTKLKKQHSAYVTRIFWFMVEVLLIFGVPAFIAVWLIKTQGKELLPIVLPIAFVFSWVVVIVRYRQIQKKVKALETEIAQVCDKSMTTVIPEDEDDPNL